MTTIELDTDPVMCIQKWAEELTNTFYSSLRIKYIEKNIRVNINSSSITAVCVFLDSILRDPDIRRLITVLSLQYPDKVPPLISASTSADSYVDNFDSKMGENVVTLLARLDVIVTTLFWLGVACSQAVEKNKRDFSINIDTALEILRNSIIQSLYNKKKSHVLVDNNITSGSRFLSLSGLLILIDRDLTQLINAAFALERQINIDGYNMTGQTKIHMEYIVDIVCNLLASTIVFVDVLGGFKLTSESEFEQFLMMLISENKSSDMLN